MATRFNDQTRYSTRGRRESTSNALTFTFQIMDVLCYGVHDTVTGKSSAVGRNPNLHPEVLKENQIPGTWCSFRFLLISESPSNLTKILPDDNNDFYGESHVIPFAAPYAVYTGKAHLKDLMDPKKISDGGPNKKKPMHRFSYCIDELQSYGLQKPSELSEKMIRFILKEELALPDASIGFALAKTRSMLTANNGKSYVCHNITKLKDSPQFSQIWNRYLKESPHGLGHELKMVMSWFSLSLKKVNVYDRATIKILTKIYNHCITNPLDVYFENEIHQFWGENLEDESTTDLVPSGASFGNRPASIQPRVRDQFGDGVIIAGTVRKDAFLSSMKSIPELRGNGAYEKIIEIDLALKQMKEQLGKDTVLYSFKSPDAYGAVNELLRLGLIIRRTDSLRLESPIFINDDNSSNMDTGWDPAADNDDIQLPYYKLVEHERSTETILKGVRKIFGLNKDRNEAFVETGFLYIPKELDVTKLETGDEIDATIRTKKTIDVEHLDDVQRMSYNLIINERKPIVCITGGPGTGKTKLIRTLYQFYEANEAQHMFFATSFINAASVRLTAMGVPAIGIWALYFSWKAGNHDTLNLLFKLQMLVVEEFSTCSEQTTAMLMEMILKGCPNLTQLILVFDDRQIRPIDNGNPAINFKNVFQTYGLVCEFVKNHRVLAHPECAILAKNAAEYRNHMSSLGGSHQFVMNHTKIDSIKDVSKRGCFNITSDVINNFKTLYKTTGFTDLVLDFQTICLTNKRVAFLNTILDSVMKERADTWLEGYFQNDELAKINDLESTSNMKKTTTIQNSFYVGQRLIITKNYQKESNLPGITMSQACLNFETKEITVVKKTTTLITESVINGEFAVVRNIFRYYYAEAEMIDVRLTKEINQMGSNPYATILELWNPQFNVRTGKVPTEMDLVEILTSNKSGDTKMIMIHDQLGIPASIVEMGWAVTVDKYQGYQSKNINLDLQSKDGLHFSREHGLVAISRAEDRLIIFGQLKELESLAQIPPLDRTVDLEWRLKQMIDLISPSK